MYAALEALNHSRGRPCHTESTSCPKTVLASGPPHLLSLPTRMRIGRLSSGCVKPSYLFLAERMSHAGLACVEILYFPNSDSREGLTVAALKTTAHLRSSRFACLA